MTYVSTSAMFVCGDTGRHFFRMAESHLVEVNITQRIRKKKWATCKNYHDDRQYRFHIIPYRMDYVRSGAHGRNIQRARVLYEPRHWLFTLRLTKLFPHRRKVRPIEFEGTMTTGGFEDRDNLYSNLLREVASNKFET